MLYPVYFNCSHCICFYSNDLDKNNIYREGKYEWKFCGGTNSSYVTKDFILAQLRRVVPLVK
jgi:hypothetical protein